MRPDTGNDTGTVRAPDVAELADAAAMWRSAYVHIPFCRRRCPYCDFAVVAEDEGGDAPTIDRYVDAVVREVARAPDWRPLHAVNFGGGTPSALEPAAIERILGALDARFGIASEAEVSLEANPEDGSEAVVAAWRSIGVTRVSWGVQSFDPGVLRSLGRLHTPDEARAAVTSALNAGGLSVGMDLIYGTPGETTASWQRSIDCALDLGIDHLSAYSLTVEPGTRLFRDVAAGAAAPDPDDQADKYELLQRATAASDLVRYEVSNYARPGHTCRYNLATWAQGEYLGFGLGAHSHRTGVRARNGRRLASYLAAIEADRSPRVHEEAGGGLEREQERLILGLRRTAGVRAGELGMSFLSTAEGRRLVDAGVVSLVGDRLVVLRPLLTDVVSRAVLAAVPGLSVSPGDC